MYLPDACLSILWSLLPTTSIDWWTQTAGCPARLWHNRPNCHRLHNTIRQLCNDKRSSSLLVSADPECTPFLSLEKHSNRDQIYPKKTNKPEAENSTLSTKMNEFVQNSNIQHNIPESIWKNSTSNSRTKEDSMLNLLQSEDADKDSQWYWIATFCRRLP